MQLICNCQAIRRRLRYKFNNVDLLSFIYYTFFSLWCQGTIEKIIDFAGNVDKIL